MGNHLWRDPALRNELLERYIQICLAMMLALALTLGAGTRGRELTTLALQLMGLAVLPAALFCLSSRTKSLDRLPIVLCGLILAVPLVQLVPLPADLWTQLPGRALAVETLKVAGVPLTPHPVSLTPDATWAAFLWLVPAVCLFLAALCLSDRRYRQLAVIAVGFLILGTVLATVQFSTPLRWPTHPFSNNDFPIGFFANKNHQAAALAVGLPISAAIAVYWRHRSSRIRHLGVVLYGGLTLALLAGIVATSSRAGLALGGLGALVGGLIYGRSAFPGKLDRRLAWILLPVVLAVAAVVAVGGGSVTTRLSEPSADERRLDSWPTIFKTANAVQPVGTGLGSFDSIYRSVEPTDTMSRQYVNEAHNDYLQLWLEAGFAFLIPFLLFCAWLALASARVSRAAATRDASLDWAVLSGVVILLIHSFVDYPMRTQAMVCVFALFSSRLARRGGDGERRQRTPEA